MEVKTSIHLMSGGLLVLIILHVLARTRDSQGNSPSTGLEGIKSYNALFCLKC